MNSERSDLYAEKIYRISEYISQNIDEDLSLAVLCEVANLSRFHFHRVFASYTGVTLAKFVQMVRLKRASFQLAYKKEHKIIDIAYEAGFDSPEAFSRAFKRVFQCTPRQFRQYQDWPSWHSKFTFKPVLGDRPMKVDIVYLQASKVAALEHRESPDRLLETAAQFVEWRKNSGLSPVNSSKTYGIAYSDPNSVAPEEFRFDLCGSIDIEVPDNVYGVKTKTLAGGRYAVSRHTGSHDTLENTVYFLFREWLTRANEDVRDAPLFFHYLNFIHDVREHELLTDVYLPLK